MSDGEKKTAPAKDHHLRYQRIWRLLYALCHRWICRKFHMTHEDLNVDGPVLLIPNHVSAWDPLLVAMSLKKKQVYFVASEHLFRRGLVSRLIRFLVAPIPRSKASTGADTVKACLRHLKAGHSVCLFAEGEQSWDGRTAPIFPATGKLAKASGAALVTYRLEGGYLSLPRWGRGVRRGAVHGGQVHIYPPERLREMSAEEINRTIEEDIAEDCWERQSRMHVAFRGRRRAEGLEKALYLCPGCTRVSTLRTEQDRIFCDCGWAARYTEEGSFQPEQPFPTIAQWEDWQRRELRLRTFPHEERLFADEGMALSRLYPDHRQEDAGCGALEQYEDRLVCAGRSFSLEAVSHMAMVQANLLLFSYQEEYWQIRSETGANLRKYLEIWKETQDGLLSR